MQAKVVVERLGSAKVGSQPLFRVISTVEAVRLLADTGEGRRRVIFCVPGLSTGVGGTRSDGLENGLDSPGTDSLKVKGNGMMRIRKFRG